MTDEQKDSFEMDWPPSKNEDPIGGDDGIAFEDGANVDQDFRDDLKKAWEKIKFWGK